MEINNIEDLKALILDKSITDKQIIEVINNTLFVYFPLPLPPRKELADKIETFFYKYSNIECRPLFIDL